MPPFFSPGSWYPHPPFIRARHQVNSSLFISRNQIFTKSKPLLPHCRFPNFRLICLPNYSHPSFLTLLPLFLSCSPPPAPVQPILYTVGTYTKLQVSPCLPPPPYKGLPCAPRQSQSLQVVHVGPFNLALVSSCLSSCH